MATNRGSRPPLGRVQGLIQQFGGGARRVFDTTRHSIQAVAQGLRPVSSLPNISRLHLNSVPNPVDPNAQGLRPVSTLPNISRLDLDFVPNSVDTNAPRIPSLSLERGFTVEFAPTLGGLPGQTINFSSSGTALAASGVGSFAPGDDNVFNGTENIQVTSEARRSAARRDAERRAAERQAEATNRMAQMTSRGQTVNEVFISSAHGRPDITQDGWVGSKVLGSGGQGVAGLWLKKSSTGRTIDRMVVKEVHEKHGTSGRFDSDVTWWTDQKTQKYELPREAKVGILLNPKPRTQRTNLVKTFNYRVDRPRRKYRIYMEYAGNETVWDLVRSQNKLVQSPDRTSMSIHVRIPEPFCWYMLHRLAEALAVMANPGHTIEDYPDWADPQVIHHDIKLDNVFLGVPDPNNFPLYPVPKIGDFGSARVTYKGDADNPSGWRGEFMTVGYIPPEMDSGLRDIEETAREFRTHATNVFQVGAMLRYMMQLQTREGGEQIRYRHAYNSWDTRYEDWKYPMDGCDMYSQDLRDLVARCLDPHHRNQPSPQDILDACNNVGTQHLQGMGDPVGAKLEGRRPFRLRFSRPSDVYKVGLSSMRFPRSADSDRRPQSTPAAAGAPDGNNNAGRGAATN